MRTLFLIASLGFAAGCVGDVEGMDGSDPVNPPQTTTNPTNGDLTQAKMKFDTNVYPIISAQTKCGSAGCHAQAGTGGSVTKFVATNPSDGWSVATQYTALVGNFTSSAAPILTMVKSGHKGMSYTSGEEAKIVEWLDAEVSARNGQPSQPQQPQGETLSQATERVLSAFAGCMQKTDFDAANMANAWGNMNTNNNSQCENCHATGGEGFIASRNSQFMYDVVSTKKYYFLQYLTVDLTGGAAAAKVVINQASFLGVSQGQDPHREHPRFNATNNQGMTALTQFYNATMTRVGTAGLCAPKPLQNQ
jgi:hypothetical protein